MEMWAGEGIPDTTLLKGSREGETLIQERQLLFMLRVIALRNDSFSQPRFAEIGGWDRLGVWTHHNEFV